MLGMNGDMGGSAVAFATLVALAKLKANFNVVCYLAISDNDIGSKAFRPNEVVTSLSGKTVETIHTDAEGRMVLADTLCLASKDNYNLPKLRDPYRRMCESYERHSVACFLTTINSPI